MKFCPSCGVKLDNDNFKFCPECGYKFGSDTSNSNKEKSGGFISSFIKGIRNEIPDEYVDKIKDNETIDDAITHAKIIWHGPKTEKEKEYRKRKQEEKERRKQEYQEIRKKHKKKVEIQEEEIIDKKVDNTINQETEKPKKETLPTTIKKEIPAKQIIAEPDYSNLELSDLQKTLIKTLPLINNPSEYEENIIKKYSEYNSKERKELLKDCWTVTKLAEKHNIKRHEVEKAILTDEFLNKGLIGVFKVNPNNIRSLKILYRKQLNETQQIPEISDEIKEEPVQESKINENETIEVEEVTVEEKNGGESVEETVGEVVEEKAIEDEIPQPEINKTFYNKKASNAKTIKKEFNNQLKFYLGSFRGSEDFKKRLIRHNKMFGDTNLYSIKNILKKEFENGNLALEDVERRIDELLELDVLALQHDVADKKRDSSVIKTQEDLNNYLGSEYVAKFKKKVDRKSKGEELFKKYNVNVENAHCFECKLAEQRRDTVMTEFKENAWGNGYVALFDDKLVIADETFLLKVNLSVEKVFFSNVDFISFEEGDEDSPSSLYIGLRTKGQIILGYILPEDANKVIEKYEKYTGKSNSSENTSNADELLKYADLYKQGLISKEEFETKKKELL